MEVSESQFVCPVLYHIQASWCTAYCFWQPFAMVFLARLITNRRENLIVACLWLVCGETFYPQYRLHATFSLTFDGHRHGLLSRSALTVCSHLGLIFG